MDVKHLRSIVLNRHVPDALAPSKSASFPRNKVPEYPRMLKKLADLLKDEKRRLAPYAMLSALSAGRVHMEPQDAYRLPFQRDRDRIIHCRSFRRLQAKTQVFVSYYGDHYRDRLTHSMEVAQIARSICRNLGLNEDLAECISLAHDLGHPPFGHGGEEALNEVMHKFGLGFEHNEQSRRIIEKLEKIYPGFDGLNCTKEVLDGLLKHNPHQYHTYLKFNASPHLEAQVMDIADQIAYVNHDVDDGLRSGIIILKEISDYELWREAQRQVTEKYGRGITKNDVETRRRFISRVVSRMIKLLVHDLVKTTNQNLIKQKINSLADVRESEKYLIVFSKKTSSMVEEIRPFLMKNFYMNPKVAVKISRGKKIIKKLFMYYIDNPKKLPEPFLAQIKSGDPAEIVVKDYIAGMTDHFAEESYTALK
jgi:dGTPase